MCVSTDCKEISAKLIEKIIIRSIFGKPPGIPDLTYEPEPCHDVVHRVCRESVPKLSPLVKHLSKYLARESFPNLETVKLHSS